ncbi:MAG: DUF1674 domain-containing protein [Nitratireductor sp.]
MTEPKFASRAGRPVPEAGKRALSEAAERHRTRQADDLPREINGRNGPEPTRFGDWEKDGIVSDF